jgi:hypothetical protein
MKLYRKRQKLDDESDKVITSLKSDNEDPI